MPNWNLEARPTLKGGNVSWTLCDMKPNPPKCGDSNATYPNIELGPNGQHTIVFTIANDHTGKVIKFAKTNPIWIKEGSKPTGSGVDAQILTVTGHGTQVLTIVDKNDKPDSANPTPYVMRYQLNFIDKNDKKVASIDPAIKNGGTTIVDNSQATLLLAGAGLVLLLAAIFLSIRSIRNRRQLNAGGRP